MSGYFLDTSALGKRYHLEVGTADVDAIFQTPGAQIFTSLASPLWNSARPLPEKYETNQSPKPVISTPAHCLKLTLQNRPSKAFD